MRTQGLSKSRSFDPLSEISQRQRRKVHDIAADIANGPQLRV